MSDIKRVHKRTFVRHFSRYLKETGTFCLTNKENEEYIVTISSSLSDTLPVTVKRKKEEFKEDLSKAFDHAPIFSGPKLETPSLADMKLFFNCGCRKDDSFLCEKHRNERKLIETRIKGNY